MTTDLKERCRPALTPCLFPSLNLSLSFSLPPTHSLSPTLSDSSPTLPPAAVAIRHIYPGCDVRWTTNIKRPAEMQPQRPGKPLHNHTSYTSILCQIDIGLLFCLSIEERNWNMSIKNRSVGRVCVTEKHTHVRTQECKHTSMRASTQTHSPLIL